MTFHVALSSPLPLRSPAAERSPGEPRRRTLPRTDRLSSIVEFDRRYLPDVAGVRLVHLQCHIGTDTLSWAKLGAEVTGYDFSAPALEVARDLATRAGLDARFVRGDLYEAPQHLEPGSFDVVYEWNHGLGEILTAVLDAGLEIRRFEEHREIEWQAWHLFEPTDDGRYALPGRLRDLVPTMYTLVAEKR